MITRILTGILLVVIGITMIKLGGFPFFLWVFGVTILSSNELFFMMKKAAYKPYNIISFVLIFIAFLSISPNNLGGILDFAKGINIWDFLPIKILVLLVVAFSSIEVFRKHFFLPKNRFFANFKILLFILCTFPFIYLVRAGDNGLLNIFYCYLLIWVSDTSALFSGKLFGKHKLTSISPKKTVEGAVISFFIALICAYILILIFNFDKIIYLSLAIIISIFAQIGDLHESLTKRFFKVKDSSNLLPGHGGIYDRADSGLLIMPIIYYFFNW
jgi:phosphatidate cytidylyltransferase